MNIEILKQLSVIRKIVFQLTNPAAFISTEEKQGQPMYMKLYVICCSLLSYYHLLISEIWLTMTSLSLKMEHSLL